MGVPRIILNYTQGVNYSNAETQYRKFIENTIRPIEDFLEYCFGIMIAPINSTVEFEIVDDHIDDKLERCDVAIKNVASGIWTRNEARDYIGDEMVEDELMDEYTVANTVVPLSIAMANPLQTENTDAINQLKNGA